MPCPLPPCGVGPVVGLVGPRRSPRKPEGRSTMENDPSQCFFTEASEQGQGHRLQGERSNGATSFFVWQRARNDDITANKRQQPYHTSVEHTAPHRQGGANRNDHRPHRTGVEGTTISLWNTLPLTGGAGPTKKTKAPLHRGGDEATQDQPGKRGKQQGQTRRLPT